MIQSTSLEIFCASSPTKSRSNEGNKIPSYLEEKDGNLLDQLVTSSIASSGYWEDCDSLVTSEYDVFGVNWAYCHHNERIKSFKSKHSSLTEGAVESPSVRARSFNVRQTSAPGKTSLVGDFTADRQSYPTFYADCKELQLLNLSHNNDSNSVRLSSEDNGCVSLKNDSLDGFDSITSDLLPCDKSYPPKQDTHSLQEVFEETEDGPKKTYIHLKEWEDSEDEEVLERKEPRTKFEAALLRAEEESRRRKALLEDKDVSTSGKVMPEWGSPIQIRANPNQNKFMQCYFASDTPPSNTSSPRVGRSTDLCREVEEWLQSRPSWIDQRYRENNPALQICFLNSSEQNLFSSMEAIDAEPQGSMETVQVETQVADFPTAATSTTTNTSTAIAAIGVISTVNSNTVNSKQLMMNGNLPNSNHTEEENVMSSSTTGRSSLLLAFESSINLISLINEIDMYYERLLDQCKHDCYNARSVVYLQELIRTHKRFQSETQIAVVQIPKISAMQAEVERMKMPSLSPNVAKLLRVDLKKFQICKTELIKFSTSQLQVIMNDIHSRIEDLNNSLMLLLVERDDLHLEQGGKLVALEDIKSWIKELNIRSLIPQVRRQFFLNLPSNLSNNVYNDGLFPKSQTRNTLPRKPRWMTSLFSRVSQRQALSL